MRLEHSRIYRNDTHIAVKIPFTEEMKEFFGNGDFPLIKDPLKERATAIIGMFILRPGSKAWTEPILRHDGSLSIYDAENWVYSIEGISGGGIIANGNVMDGYRLAMQYAITDAVIIGSNTIVKDGVPGKDGNSGYLWLPQFCAVWPHLKASDPKMLNRFKGQRKLMQQLGYASRREYPAQIAVTRSGKETDPDILSASIFHEKLPDGSPIETYIVTSSTGAARLRQRSAAYGLEHRINDILITLSPAEKPGELELQRLPEILFRDYNIIIANHDGGKTVLEAFCQEGIIDQFNFTFARKPSLFRAIENSSEIPEETKTFILNHFNENTMNFFDTESGKLPEHFPVVEIIVDEPDEAAVVVLDTRKIRSFSK